MAAKIRPPQDSDAHTRKRPYQPSITSFFNRNAAKANASLVDCSISPSSPPLPAETQASLLSVGMRVRKSVPEGYKTHKTIGADGFPFPSTAPSKTMPQRPEYSSHASSRELTPFCGLHKIGGFAQQQEDWAPASSAPAALQGQEGTPGLNVSQSTFASTQSQFEFGGMSGQGGSGAKKRGFEEDIESDMDEIFGDMETLGERKGCLDGRPLARLKGTGPKEDCGPWVAINGVDGEGLEQDFEEAGFLAPDDGMEVDV